MQAPGSDSYLYIMMLEKGFTEEANSLSYPSYHVGDHQVGSERGGKKCGQRKKRAQHVWGSVGGTTPMAGG